MYTPLRSEAEPSVFPRPFGYVTTDENAFLMGHQHVVQQAPAQQMEAPATEYNSDVSRYFPPPYLSQTSPIPRSLVGSSTVYAAPLESPNSQHFPLGNPYSQQPASPVSLNSPAVDGSATNGDSEELIEDKDSMPYAHLIYMCLKDAPGHAMVLKDIYTWFEKNTDKAAGGSGKGWQNSIRHNLSMNQAFRKIEQTPCGDNGKRGFIWVLDKSAIDAGGVQSTTRFRKTGIAMPARGRTRGVLGNRRQARIHKRIPASRKHDDGHNGPRVAHGDLLQQYLEPTPEPDNHRGGQLTHVGNSGFDHVYATLNAPENPLNTMNTTQDTMNTTQDTLNSSQSPMDSSQNEIFQAQSSINDMSDPSTSLGGLHGTSFPATGAQSFHFFGFPDTIDPHGHEFTYSGHSSTQFGFQRPYTPPSTAHSLAPTSPFTFQNYMEPAEAEIALLKQGMPETRVLLIDKITCEPGQHTIHCEGYNCRV